MHEHLFVSEGFRNWLEVISGVLWEHSQLFQSLFKDHDWIGTFATQKLTIAMRNSCGIDPIAIIHLACIKVSKPAAHVGRRTTSSLRAHCPRLAIIYGETVTHSIAIIFVHGRSPMEITSFLTRGSVSNNGRARWIRAWTGKHDVHGAPIIGNYHVLGGGACGVTSSPQKCYMILGIYYSSFVSFTIIAKYDSNGIAPRPKNYQCLWGQREFIFHSCGDPTGIGLWPSTTCLVVHRKHDVASALVARHVEYPGMPLFYGARHCRGQLETFHPRGGPRWI